MFEQIIDLPETRLEYVTYDSGKKIIFMKLERLEQLEAQTYQFKQLDSNFFTDFF